MSWERIYFQTKFVASWLSLEKRRLIVVSFLSVMTAVITLVSLSSLFVLMTLVKMSI